VGKYIKQNVVCKFCSSTNTCIKKNIELRSYQLDCGGCLSNYSI
jgi:translation initiation factor 2 beta subunit (eIF-2beta)/eIF-5